MQDLCNTAVEYSPRIQHSNLIHLRNKRIKKKIRGEVQYAYLFMQSVYTTSSLTYEISENVGKFQYLVTARKQWRSIQRSWRESRARGPNTT
jgi:hypothetical protein